MFHSFRYLRGKGSGFHKTIMKDYCRREGHVASEIGNIYSRPLTTATHAPGQEVEDPACDPNNPIIVSYDKVLQAQKAIAGAIKVMPCQRSQMSDLFNMDIYFKKEYTQYTGTFKERGAMFCLLNLPPEQKKKGVIAASAGNHALALSYHGKLLGIPVNVVMPTIAPLMKITACRKYGATIKIEGNNIVESRTVALKMAKEMGLAYINGYDHEDIIAGQGTIGLEILKDVPDLDACIVPIGGGGMIAGTALAIKTERPDVRIIGVQAENCPSFKAAMDVGRPIYTETKSTLANGLAVPTVGVNAFQTVMAKNLIDRNDVFLVKEEFIELAILRCIELEKAVIEGGGATGLAAIIQGLIPGLEGKKVVIILSGGNIDTTVLGRVIERALAEDNRLVKFQVSLSDRPGSIAELTKLMGDLGVSIKDIFHERPWEKHDVFSAMVKVVCETRGEDHSKELHDAIKKKYPNVHLIWGHRYD